MAQLWTTIDTAAKRLSVTTRTIRRRIAAGELHARSTPDGKRREVLVDVTPDALDIAVDTVSALEKQSDRQIQIASVTITQAQEETKRWRGSARRWSAAAVALLAALAGGTWLLATERAQATAMEAQLSTKATDLQATRRRAETAAVDLHQARADRRKAQEARLALMGELATARVDLANLRAKLAIITGETGLRGTLRKLTQALTARSMARPPRRP